MTETATGERAKRVVASPTVPARGSAQRLVRLEHDNREESRFHGTADTVLPATAVRREVCKSPARTPSSGPSKGQGDSRHPDIDRDPMTLANHSPPANAALAQRIRQRISERTGGQILGLEVIVSDTRVAVCGRARSYYHTQSAVHEVRKTVGSLLSIDMDFEVTARP